MTIKALILEPQRGQLQSELEMLGYTLRGKSVQHPEDVLSFEEQVVPHILLCAYPFQEFAVLLAWFTALRTRYPLLPVILIVHIPDELPFLELLNEGASGYVLRENLTHLPALIQKVVQHQAEKQRVNQLLETRLVLSAFSITSSMDELLQKTLDEAEKLTNSQIGFFHFMEADQETLFLQTWSTNTLQKMCNAEGKGAHYQVSQAGVWVDCIRERQSVIHNDYAALPYRQGLPKGHAPILREMVIPVIQNDEIFAILGVGNKPEAYTRQDVEIVSQLAYMAWDLVKRKRAEQTLAKNEQHLRQVQALKTFIQNTAHEFRTPLASINTNLYLLVHSDVPAVQKAKEEKIKALVQQISHKLDLLLRVTELESMESLTFQDVNVGGLLGTLCHELQMAKGDSPPLQQQLIVSPLVMGDPHYLTRAFEEILDNAYRFTPQEGVISVHMAVEANMLHVDISDKGIGIPRHQVEHIFDLFWRDDTVHTTPGLGLGLPIARRIVELHGGQISVESQPGVGSTFRVMLPVKATEQRN